jgi:hypothetical protein
MLWGLSSPRAPGRTRYRARRSAVDHGGAWKESSAMPSETPEYPFLSGDRAPGRSEDEAPFGFYGQWLPQ